jgi:hypothetical protein
MTTDHRPPTADHRPSLQAATQELRQLLETEFSEQLSGTFDILPDGSIAKQPGQHLVDPKQRLIRRKVVEAINHLISGGKTAQEAVQYYIREAAFTFLNRFVALRMMEARGLLQPCVSKGDQSSGFKEFCGLAPGLVSLPDGGYRLYLECLFDELSVEIKVLFNRRDAASLLWPRRNALNKVLEILSREKLAAAWNADETIGWVYQGFNSKELEKAFREARLSGKKFEARDIPAVTQLFTQRWIVRFLVENTLGRLWIDMHPDSQIAQSFDYLVPLDGKRVAPLKSVREIRLIDPSCGTMHFGLVAFDLFAEMYREEMINVGNTGWPNKASASSEAEIPASILAHNLFGIDIDHRAVQLSALTLYLKAKSLNPQVRLTETRLACADVHMLNGEYLGQFLAASGLEKRPIFERILKTIQERLQDAEQLGSLLRLEEEIRELIYKEKTLYEKDASKPYLFGWSKEQFESDAVRKEFWETLEIQIRQALDAFAREQAEKDNAQSYFADETTKGLRLLDVLNQRYDVVVTNPPYLSGRKMNNRMKKLVADSYKAGKGDLYAAFILRCIELAAETGRVGMLTMHSFMFISSYEEMRNQLREKVAVDTLVHAGPALFSVGNPGTLQTAAFVLRREPNDQARNESVGTYFRLVKQPDAESKRKRFEQAVASLRSGDSDSTVYRYKQSDFDAIPGSPWVYWTASLIRNLFLKLPKLGSVSNSVTGINTGDNFRFRKFWWERSGPLERHWKRFVSGGEYLKWYGNLDYIVNMDVKSMAQLHGSALRARDYWYRSGITYCLLSSKGFNARILPEGYVFSSGGNCTFTESEELLISILGILNSELGDYLLKLINPTINFPVGTVSNVPVVGDLGDELCALVRQAIEQSKKSCEILETSFDFVAPRFFHTNDEEDIKKQSLNAINEAIDNEIYKLYKIEPEVIELIRRELEEIPREVSDGTEEVDDESASLEADFSDDIITKVSTWISYSFGLAIGRFQPGIENALGRGDFSPKVSEQLRALADSDGMMVLDAGHPHDLAAKVHQALNLMLGDEDARQCIHGATGREGDLEEELRRYFAGDFFKEHLQKYRKRPVYWLLQSPRKTYGVYLFHERITKDTLYRIRSDQYVGSKLKLLNTRLEGLQIKAEGLSGRELRTLQKSIEETESARDDLQDFTSKIENLIALGYEPNIDDGVLINMAPLWQLIPSWSTEPKKCWDKLVAGDYDWSHMAMHLWPQRVIPKCTENASYAIAHGLDTIFWTQDDRNRFQPKPKPDGGWKPTIDKLIAERIRPGVAKALTILNEAASVKKVPIRGRKR